MQLTRGNFIEKILRNSNGQIVRVTFCLYEHEGRIKARVVHVEEVQTATEPLALCGRIQSNIASSDISPLSGIVSPYVTVNPLYVSGSKPRAPTF